jgi:hypothetical protein
LTTPFWSSVAYYVGGWNAKGLFTTHRPADSDYVGILDGKASSDRNGDDDEDDDDDDDECPDDEEEDEDDDDDEDEEDDDDDD